MMYGTMKHWWETEKKQCKERTKSRTEKRNYAQLVNRAKRAKRVNTRYFCWFYPKSLSVQL